MEPSEAEEIEKCRKDFLYFVENYIRIENSPIKLTEFQKEYVKGLQEGKMAVIHRKGGMTTLSNLMSSWNKWKADDGEQ